MVQIEGEIVKVSEWGSGNRPEDEGEGGRELERHIVANTQERLACGPGKGEAGSKVPGRGPVFGLRVVDRETDMRPTCVAHAPMRSRCLNQGLGIPRAWRLALASHTRQGVRCSLVAASAAARDSLESQTCEFEGEGREQKAVCGKL